MEVQLSRKGLAAGVICLSTIAFGAGRLSDSSNPDGGDAPTDSSVKYLPKESDIINDSNLFDIEVIPTAPSVRIEAGESSDDLRDRMADMGELISRQEITIEDLRNQVAQLEAEKRCLQSMVSDPFALDERYLSLSSDPALQSWLKDFLTITGLKLENLPPEGDYWERFVPEFKSYRNKAIETVEDYRRKYSDLCASLGNDDDQIARVYVERILTPYQDDTARLANYYGSVFGQYLIGVDPSFQQHLFGNVPESIKEDSITGHLRPSKLVP